MSQYPVMPVGIPDAELMKRGAVVIDKPSGPTSHQISAWTRNLVGADRAAHAGTLDPKVTGVLAIGIGPAVRALPYLLDGPKEYVCLMRLHAKVPEARLRGLLGEFVGDVYQTPPVRAAVKRERRVRKIHELEVLEIDDEFVLFRTLCESGTYIRTLCHDAGEILGIGANMAELRRTRTAHITEHDAIALQGFSDYLAFARDGKRVTASPLRPLEFLLLHLKHLHVKDTAADALCHGASLMAPGILEAGEPFGKGEKLVLTTAKGEAVAVAEALHASSALPDLRKGEVAKPLSVLMEPGTYQKCWK